MKKNQYRYVPGIAVALASLVAWDVAGCSGNRVTPSAENSPDSQKEKTPPPVKSGDRSPRPETTTEVKPPPAPANSGTGAVADNSGGQPANSAPTSSTPSSAERIEVIEENYFDGTPKSREEVKYDTEGNKIPHGLLQLWWEDGKTKKLEMRFVDGVPQGLKTAWFRDGQKWSEGLYVDGKEHGIWTVWYPDGKKQHELPMDYGAFHGIETRWHANGQMLLQGEWVHGKQKGFFTYWDEKGKLAREIDYGNPQP